MKATILAAMLQLLPMLLLLATVAHSSYIENIAANVDNKPASPSKSRSHAPFIPMVAFHCDHRNKFMGKDGEWHDDPSSAATCLQGKYDIMKYCKRVYPGEEITNIVEYSHVVGIDKWCKEDGTRCARNFNVRPYRCIVGNFVTESLQVPQNCHFSHNVGSRQCNDHASWAQRAETECATKEDSNKQKMKLRSYAILEPCGLDMWRGVEYVCCPRAGEESAGEKVVDLEMDVDDDADDYDDDEEEESEKSAKKGDEREKPGLDPYFNDLPEGESDATTEHERFREAEERLERRHRKKVTKVITEWSELFEHYNTLKTKDPKGAEEYKREMTARFRKTVASLEAENREQRAQIEEVHDERIQNILNERKRKATHEYRAALAVQVGSANKNNVLRTLKNYIKAEEKDRAHMLNRYRHLLRTDPEQAATFEALLLHRLRYIDLRVNGTLAMLRDFPSLEKQVRPVAIGFWKEYRRENTPDPDESNEASNNELLRMDLLAGDEQNERLVRLYKQASEHNHPSLAALIESSAKNKGKQVVSTTRPSVHQTVVGLKDVLKEQIKEDGDLSEDSDEDQFEEDQDKDKLASSSSSSPSSSSHSAGEKEAKKAVTPNSKQVALNLLKAMKPWKVELSGSSADGEESRLAPRKKGELKQAKQASAKDDDADDDEDDDTEEATEGREATKKSGLKAKTLTVSIEPIVSGLKVNREKDARVNEMEEEEGVRSIYSPQDMLVVEVEKYPQERPSWSGSTNLAIALMACAMVVLLIGLFLRRRSRHPGFIEVDICTPEERHLNGMRVSGYENPTYAFFDSAKA